MSPDDGMDLTDFLIKPCLSWVCGGEDLMGRFLCGDVLCGCFHVVTVWVALGKAALHSKSAPGKGERRQEGVLS